MFGLAMFALVALTVWHMKSAAAPTREARKLRWRRRLYLIVTAAVAVGLSAVQWIPSWEFGRLSVRAAPQANIERYVFWIGPWRFLEMLWPNFAGRQFPQNSRWTEVFELDDRLWEPSLYLGALPLVLAVAAWGVRNCTHWQRWLSVTLVLALWGATGPAGGLSWYLYDAPFLHPKEIGRAHV